MPSDRALLARVLARRAAPDEPYRVSWRRDSYPAALVRTFSDKLSAEVWFQTVLRQRTGGVLLDLRLDELTGAGWEQRSVGRASRAQRHEARRRTVG